MLKIFIAFILLFQAAFASALSLDDRRKKILGIIDEELSEVTRLAKQQDFRSPDTLLRVSELNMEKARLWREAENEKFLSIPPEQRRSLNKGSFFERSSSYFNSANKSARYVIKKFPQYKNIGDVYYVLAYNYKELGNNKLAQKYFAYSAKTSQPNTKIGSKSKLALAEFYFNDNKFKEAIPLYEAALNKVDEKWWTKDAFNLAWSYYRLKNYSKAIDLMQEIHRRSGSNKYVDMKSLVERDIGIFYIDAGRLSDAVKFYEKLGINYTEQFVKIATAIVSQGRFAQAETLLEQAAKYEKDRGRQIEIMMAQLDLFDKYNKVGNHLKVSRLLVKLHQEKALNNDHLKRLNYHVNKKAAELQKATAADIYKNVPKVKRVKASQAIAYFNLAAELEPEQSAEKKFFQGETAFAADNFPKALNFYISSFDEARKKSDKKIIVQSLEGMLSSLGQKSFPAKTAEKYYIPVYERYLSVDSSSPRANSIFVKLFNSQYDGNQITEAEQTMSKFAANFPKDYKTQEGMLAKVMEYYRKNKDYDKVKLYVGKINSGEFKVSRKYADALRSLMTKIQIEGVQQSLEKGDKGVALKGYHQIYESAESTPKAKINASYNLAALYYELGDMGKSYQWGTTALKDMDSSDVVKFSESFLSMSAGLFLKQHFAQSADLSYRTLAKLCKENSSNKVVSYKNAAFIALANNDIDKALEIRDFGKNCHLPENTITEVSLEVLKELAQSKRWESYETLIAELARNQKNFPLLIAPYENLRQVYKNLGDSSKASSLEQTQYKLFNQSKAQQLDIPVEALDLMAGKMMEPVLGLKEKLEKITLSFPENEFNNAVKNKLQILDQLTTQVNVIQKTGSGKGIVEAYKHVIEAYEGFGESLKKFVPEGKSPEYVASFSKAMAEVYIPILNNARKQRNEIKNLISKNKILSESNYSVLYPQTESFKRFVTEKDSILMDRGGRK